MFNAILLFNHLMTLSESGDDEYVRLKNEEIIITNNIAKNLFFIKFKFSVHIFYINKHLFFCMQSFVYKSPFYNDS